MRELTVRVPATSANLGPGFDCLGIAFKLYNWFTFRWQNIEDVVSPKEQLDSLAVAGISQLPMLEAYVQYADLFDVDLPLPEVVISLQNDVPVARGLGSSATCYAAGAKAAQWVAEQLYDKEMILKEMAYQKLNFRIDPFSQEAILAVAVTIEKHPDNLSPAIFGGLQISAISDSQHIPQVIHQAILVHPSVKFIVSYPNYTLRTDASRAVLPEMISHKDAVFNLSALSFLLQGMATGNSELLEKGLQDRLHQPYRAKLIEGFYDILAIGKKVGAAGSVLSGAGPAVLTVYPDSVNGDLIEFEIQQALDKNWHVLQLETEYVGLAFQEGREKF